MLKLEEILKNAQVASLEPGQAVRVVTTEPVGDNAVTVYYKTTDGALHERMLFRSDQANLPLASAGRAWAFDAPAGDFKLAAEAYRIYLAHLFDPMMVVHTSNVKPLPHQITADEEETAEEELVDRASAAQTIQELEGEIRILEGLVARAREVVHSGQDRKWDELSRLLQDTPEMRDAEGRQRKLILFSEHRERRELVREIRRLSKDGGRSLQSCIDELSPGLHRSTFLHWRRRLARCRGNEWERLLDTRVPPSPPPSLKGFATGPS